MELMPQLRRTAAAFPLLAALLASPALADQFKQTADGGTIDCSVSARELTRFALVGDQFASVSKISSGYPYNDFAVTNEPVRGDIYVSVPETFAAAGISFFATTKAGFVYKFACPVDRIEAEQVFITNPALAKAMRRRLGKQTPLRRSRGAPDPGDGERRSDRRLRIRQRRLPARVGALEVQLIAEYRGAALTGKVVRLANRGAKPLTSPNSDLAPAARSRSRSPSPPSNPAPAHAYRRRPQRGADMTDHDPRDGIPRHRRAAGSTRAAAITPASMPAPPNASSCCSPGSARSCSPARSWFIFGRRSQAGRQGRRCRDDRDGGPRQPRPVPTRIRRGLRQPARCGDPRAEGAQGRPASARRCRSRTRRAQGREPGDAHRRPGRDRCDLGRERRAQGPGRAGQQPRTPAAPLPAYGPQAGGYDARGRAPVPQGLGGQAASPPDGTVARRSQADELHRRQGQCSRPQGRAARRPAAGGRGFARLPAAQLLCAGAGHRRRRCLGRRRQPDRSAAGRAADHRSRALGHAERQGAHHPDPGCVVNGAARGDLSARRSMSSSPG